MRVEDSDGDKHNVRQMDPTTVRGDDESSDRQWHGTGGDQAAASAARRGEARQTSSENGRDGAAERGRDELGGCGRRKRKARRGGQAVSTRRRTHTLAMWTNVAYQQMHEQMTVDLTGEGDDYVDVT